VTSSKVVLRVVYSAEIRVHHEDSLESKMELEFVDRVGTAVVFYNIFDGVLLQYFELIMFSELSQVHFGQVLVELELVV